MTLRIVSLGLQTKDRSGVSLSNWDRTYHRERLLVGDGEVSLLLVVSIGHPFGP